MSGAQFTIESELMENGDTNQFVKANGGADRLELVRFSFRVLTFTSH